MVLDRAQMPPYVLRGGLSAQIVLRKKEARYIQMLTRSLYYGEHAQSTFGENTLAEKKPEIKS